MSYKKLIRLITTKGYLTDNRHPLWRSQVKLIKYMMGEKCIKSIKHSSFFDEHIPNLPKNEELEMLKKFRYKKCYECNRRSYYNYEKYNFPVYCGDHKKSNMFNIRYLNGKKIYTCITEGCSNKAIFKWSPVGKGKWVLCGKCVQPNMIKKPGYCIYGGCQKYPSYHYDKGTNIYCNDHKKPGMKSKNKRKHKTNLNLPKKIIKLK
jgi:hypothetical protein